MATRKIKNAKDITTDELIYFKGHAQATFMSDGRTVEDAINGISDGSGGSIDTSNLATKEELAQKQDRISDIDTIRSGAEKGATALQSIPSEYITETELSNKGYATISALNNKVDAINGKQLSTEDFTTALKTKLEGLNNYDDTELSNAIETLRGDFDNIVSGDTTTAIKTFNEVIAFLEGLTDTQDLESIIASIEQQIAGKMDKVTLATVATSGNYNDLSNKPTIPAAITESTVSGWGFTKNTGTYSKPSSGIPKTDLASAVQTSLGKADTALQSIPTEYATKAEVLRNINSYMSGLATINGEKLWVDPSGGDNPPSFNFKTINGESILGSGDITVSADGTSNNSKIAVLEISTLTLDNQFAEYGYQLNGVAEECETTWENICESTSISELVNYLNSNYSIVINDLAYIRPCSIVYDHQGEEIYITLPGYTTTNTQYSVNQYTYEILIDSREDTILLHRYHHTQVSSAYTEINHGTDDTTWDLAPNTFNIWGEVPELYLTLMSETPNIANEFVFQFTSGSEPTTLTIDNIIGDTDIKWVNDEAPVIEANKIYQISILKGLGSVMSWNAIHKIINTCTLTLNEDETGSIGNFEFPVESELNIAYFNNSTQEVVYAVVPVGTTEVTLEFSDAGFVLEISPSEDDIYIYEII